LNIDRLLHDFEGRLAALTGEVGRDEARRREVMEALREAVGRERLRLDPDTTVERERERRQLAEELRAALEAVHGSTRPEEALEEVLKQLGRVVQVDFAAVAVAEPGGGLRVGAVRGAPPDGLIGAPLTDARVHGALAERRAVRVADAEAEGALGLAGAPALGSWVALPLLLEGDTVGVLLAGRTAVDGFSDDELLPAKAVAFWAAAALVRVQQLEQLRRYSTLLEQVVDVAQHVFEGEAADALSRRILDGACRVGRYPGGLLVIVTPRGPVVSAAAGPGLAAAVGRPVPAELFSPDARRLSAEQVPRLVEALGVALPGAEQVFVVPLATPDASVGSLVLLDPNGESPEDRLLDSYASRAAAAWRHASLRHGRS
jgi:putative methionine-R-sulfoxide reductase with GAF domain